MLQQKFHWFEETLINHQDQAVQQVGVHKEVNLPYQGYFGQYFEFV